MPILAWQPRAVSMTTSEDEVPAPVSREKFDDGNIGRDNTSVEESLDTSDEHDDLILAPHT